MNKDQWNDNVLASLNGIKRAEPNPFLFARIKQQIRDGETAKFISTSKISFALMGFALLLMLNIWATLSSSEQQNVEKSTMNSLDIFPYTLY